MERPPGWSERDFNRRRNRSDDNPGRTSYRFCLVEVTHTDVAPVVAAHVHQVERGTEPQVEAWHPHQHGALKARSQVRIRRIPATVPILEERRTRSKGHSGPAFPTAWQWEKTFHWTVLSVKVDTGSASKGEPAAVFLGLWMRAVSQNSISRKLDSPWDQDRHRTGLSAINGFRNNVDILWFLLLSPKPGEAVGSLATVCLFIITIILS